MAKSISADKRENEKKRLARRAEKQKKYLQTVVTQCFVNNKSEIWS